MKLFKISLFIIFILSLSYSIYSFTSSSQTKIEPTSEKNNFYLQLENSLKTAKIDITKSEVKDYQNQYEFYVTNESDYPIKVILSTQKNPYWQIASFQDILKTAKIRNRQLQLVDLSISHPYATFKNN